jgi:hypothetical protein
MPGWVESQFLPPDGAVLDYDHPLATGLVCALIPDRSGRMVDMARDRASGVATTRAGGKYGALLGDWSIPAAQCNELQFTSGSFTVASAFRLQDSWPAADNPTIFSNSTYVNESNNQGWFLGIAGSGSSVAGYAFAIHRNSASNLSTAHAGSPSVGDHTIVGTSNGATAALLYADGAQIASEALTFNPVSSASNVVNITGTAHVPTYGCWAWSRVLSALEVQVFNTNPFQMFRLPVGRTLGLLSPSPATASAAPTESQDTAAIAGKFATAATIAKTAGNDALSAAAVFTSPAAMAKTAAADAFAGLSQDARAALALIGFPDAFKSPAIQASNGALTGAASRNDTLAAAAAVNPAAIVAGLERGDVFAGLALGTATDAAMAFHEPHDLFRSPKNAPTSPLPPPRRPVGACRWFPGLNRLYCRPAPRMR